MTATLIISIFIIYFAVLFFISHLVSRKGVDNDAFFRANRKSPWYLVAIGMIGTSISGVTFVSVPGMVGKYDMSYMQMVLGFFFGYIVVAYVLLPLYYRLNLTSIYTYLKQRFGFWSYKSGASFFILSRIIGSAAKLYLVILILQTWIFNQWNIPFVETTIFIVFLIWLYTRRSGIKTIIWTDTIQTICFLSALVLIIIQVVKLIDIDNRQLMLDIVSNQHSKIFVFDNWQSSQNFFKQFLSGIFIVIVMTGLDQDIMQKNLTCKSLKDARKNMLSYGFLFIPVNFLFLTLGVLLLIFASRENIILPELSDEILPYLVSNHLGTASLILFSIGIVGASFTNADSALTALTTSFCIDILEIDKDNKSTRKKVHIGMSIALICVIALIYYWKQDNILYTIYKVASYTYGPLLGMFALGLFSKFEVKDKFVPYICIAAPILCYIVEVTLYSALSYQVGYEILMLNGLLTALGLVLIRTRSKLKTTI